MRTLSVVCLVLACFAFVRSQALSPDEREIVRLQDQRSLGEGKLVAYLSNTDSTLRYRAAIALANLQDTSTVQALLPLLNDQSTSVRAAAAFALGEIGSLSSQTALLARLHQETNNAAFGRIAEAVGRSGDNEGLDSLVSFEPEGLSTAVKRNLAMGALRFALRGLKSERSIWFCFDLLQEPDAETRWLALQALWRLAPGGQIDIEIAKRHDVLASLTMDKSADVRMNFATLLGRSRLSEAKDLLVTLHAAESANPDWRVQVQIVRSLAALLTSSPELFPSLREYLKSPDAHVKIAALLSITGLPPQTVQSYEDREGLRQALVTLASANDPDAVLVRGEAIVALGRHFPDEFSRVNFLADPSLTLRVRTKVIEAMSFVPTKANLDVMLHYLSDDSIRVAMAAWDFVRRFFTPFALSNIRSEGGNWEQISVTFYGKARSSLARGDMAVTNLVATALQDTAVFGMFRKTVYGDSLVIALAAAFGKLSSPNDVEAMQAVLETLGEVGDKRIVPLLEKALNDPDKTVAAVAASSLTRITGTDYSKRIPKATKPLYSNYDWRVLESMPLEQRMTVRTSKGDFKLRLLRNDAPFTVLSFVNLIRKGFYSGLTFHRVVPNFVVQGGDPRGDGWGGPGYAIRSEYSLVNYGRGSVGIASAGKDTEGCQFFITHSPQPHLNGRYTIFAEVVEGMSVVDKLQVGDTILGMALE